MEATREEYVTRHFKDGRIVYSDHRISMVAGYLSDEVSGLSAFKFMHGDDVNFTIVALQQMYDLNQGTGGSAYRLRSKAGDYIYLRTTGFLEKSDRTEETLICINTLLSDEEGERLVQEMKRRYAASVVREQTLPALTNGARVEEIPDDVPFLPAAPIPMESSPFGPPEPLVKEEPQFIKSSPQHSEPMQSPTDSCSPGASQFANLALYSPPTQPPQLSPPVAPHYPGVITGPVIGVPLDRPLRTQSVITERASVLTTTGNPGDAPVDTSGYKEVSVLKRAFSSDADSCYAESQQMQKRLHTSPHSQRQRRRDRDSQPVPVPEALPAEAPPTLSPQEQHKVLVARGAVPGSGCVFAAPWPAAPSPPPPQPPQPGSTSTCFALPVAGSTLLSPGHQCSPEDVATLGPFDDILIDNKDCMFSELPDAFSESELMMSLPSDLDVDRELARHHLQLETQMQKQATEMNQLEHDLQHHLPDQHLHSTLTQLQAQHKEQQQMLHSLKQDHHCLQRQDQLSIKQDLGV